MGNKYRGLTPKEKADVLIWKIIARHKYKEFMRLMSMGCSATHAYAKGLEKWPS